MNYPAFFDEVPSILLYDPLAEFLGALEDGVVEFSYLDAVKLAGHSCPTVASSYWITCLALRALYPDALPQRGNIRVELRQQDSDGTTGVIANVAALLTGAGGRGAFKGLAGQFDRRHTLLFGAELQAELRYTRLDSGRAVDARVSLQAVPSAPETGVLLQRCLVGDASREDQARFRELWQARVQAVLLEHAADPRVYWVGAVS